MTIYVVSHKDYEFPKDPSFIPIKVGKGAPFSSQYVSDSEGDNISDLNPCFCELTAAYWLWKNSSSRNEIVGLTHYRRYFSSNNSTLKIKGKKIASSTELAKWLSEYDIIVAKPRNYFVTSIRSHYIHAHNQSDYDLLRQEIDEQCPEYLVDFDSVMSGTKLSLYNMFVSRGNIINGYFSWLFNILFSLEKKVPYQNYDVYQKRVFGFMAERLFNVWLHHHKEYKVKYLSVVNIEGENLLLKASGLIKRHLGSKK